MFLCLTVLSTLTFADTAFAGSPYARDPQQPVDQAYTALIARYTTDKQFNSPLTDYLPASSSVPSPEKVLGHIAGAADWLPYSSDVYRYFDRLAAASPRVKVFRIGKTEEGREMIAVAIADESLIAGLKANDARLAQLADPRTIKMDDARADSLVAQTTPVYYITGTIHSVETGAPTALMELAYRLAVDNAAYIRKIRSHVITLITPIVEVDGRDRMVDIDRWHHAHPDRNFPPLMYWGHYVAHDNNRDAMGLTLNLSRNVLDTYLGWHAQVLHDLHESVPFLYDNTVGDGPYNAWVDPILVNEWQMLGWDNVQQLTKLGMPGVFTHGEFDTWSPGYLMFMAAMHNGISRLYETFGNEVSDTQQRILSPDEYARTWYKPNPPLPKVLWSLRDNNNYEQAGLLTALNYFADNEKLFLHNFYLKSRRSIEKPVLSGPAAYVLPADDTHPGAQAELLRVLQLQHAEISRASSAFTVQIPAPPKKSKGDDDKADDSTQTQQKTVAHTFPAGSYVLRMDQPYSRIVDTLLDRQYWSPDDPQKHPYDDTGWTMGAMFDADVVRVTDKTILDVPMQPAKAPGKPAFDLPGLGMHGKLPRIALMHTWLDTQTEGWWRMALDKLGVKYSYISTQSVARERNLRRKYDVILFAPIGINDSQAIVDGLPMWGNPLPWKTTRLTPNIGRIDSTEDIRPGLGEHGLANLKRFVADGGLLVTSEDTAQFAIDEGLAPGVFVAPKKDLRVVGSVLQAQAVDAHDPITRGYSKPFGVYSSNGMSFTLSNLVSGDDHLPNAKDYKRPTGRGGPDDFDAPEGRVNQAAPALPHAKTWQALPLNAEQTRNNPLVIPVNQRPHTVVRFADSDDLLISGLLKDGGDLAEHAAVVDARYGKGHTLLFAINPVWRGETIGSYALVFNAIVNFNRLGEP